MTTPHTLNGRFDAACAQLPLVAILRGIEPADAEAVGLVLFEEGFRLIEVPLNSPEPFASIAAIRRALPAEALVGAGTMLAEPQVQSLREAGGELAVMPHADPALIRAAKAAGLLCVPGVATPTEAFAALAAGADALKLFPAEVAGPAALKALRPVLPKETLVLPVGGIGPSSLAAWREAGADGFGIGGALYRRGLSQETVSANARAFITAWRALG
ncbi:MAG: 2-dehydro-3-deoxy-6-phosphogalactonate aldolase [Burkholderiales bacterium]|nr:2-dehydro-3-deoxy-6-phosphogalactonate aldolase [Burkholderiales bacterium]